MTMFAQNLRIKAKALGLSHAEVARRAGISERRYGNYVVGLREPDLGTLVRISRALAATVDELLTGENLNGHSKFERLVSAASSLSDEELEGIVVQVEALAKRRVRTSAD